MALFENIKRICSEKKISVLDLEHRAQLSENSIYAWKKTEPSIGKVKRVSDVLGVTVDELLKE